MVIRTEAFKEACSTILAATDSSELSTLTETLELKSEGKVLYLNITNKEYYCSVKFNLDHEEEFHATVNATLFLKLIAALTSDTIEMTVQTNHVSIKANGNYKIPLIFEGENLLEVPVITINNVTSQFSIGGEILQSILNYNSKELLKGTIAQPVQKMFYIDEQGCITFTSGACVNSFTLAQPIKILLKAKLVKLFKLFKNNAVNFKLGYDPVAGGLTQTKVSFETPTITLTAITECDNSLINSVPVAAIRGRASFTYPHSVVLNRLALTEAINRLLLFSAGYGSKQNLKPYSTFEFKPDYVMVYDSNKENFEKLIYQNGSKVTDEYSMILDLVDFKTVLDGCSDEYITLSFGNNKAVVLKRANIANVIPECRSASN